GGHRDRDLPGLAEVDLGTVLLRLSQLVQLAGERQGRDTLDLDGELAAGAVQQELEGLGWDFDRGGVGTCPGTDREEGRHVVPLDRAVQLHLAVVGRHRGVWCRIRYGRIRLPAGATPRQPDDEGEGE